MDKERYVIDGSRGFIGEHLVARLGEGNVTRVPRGDIHVVESGDHYFQLAAYGNLAHQEDAPEIYNANVTRLVRLLEANQTIDYKSFIVMSSLAVKLDANTHYINSKRAAEGVAKLYAVDKPVVIVRPASITGVGEQKEHLIPRLIDSCVNGTEMPFVPDPVHDYLDVEDFVDALMRVASVAQTHKGEIFPIGSGIPYSNDAVRLFVEAATGRKANIRPVESMRSYDTKHWKADTLKMQELGWEPTKTLRESIGEMVENYGLA